MQECVIDVLIVIVITIKKHSTSASNNPTMPANQN